MSKSVLITGVAGFAGAHLLQHLLANTDWVIFGVDSLVHRGNIRRVREIIDGNKSYSQRFQFIRADLAQMYSIDMLPPDIDYIINMASESHVDRSIDDPVPFVKNNINLTLTMLEYARTSKPDIFIQISTDEVYGAAPVGVEHAEWAAILPSNPYSASKAAQEALAISYWRTYDVPVVITNCMNMFGERQDTEKFVPNVIKRIANNEPVIVHGSKQHIGSRFYLHARNHADALLFIINNLPAKQYVDSDNIVRPSRYNISGDIEVNNFEMAQMIAEMMGKKLTYELLDAHSARHGHDRRYALDGSKLRSFGWTPPLDFKTSLQKTIQWSLDHKEWLA